MANILINLNPKNDETIEQRWTYKDILMPPDHKYSDNKDVNAIRGSLANIFGWRQGQRILDPDFGNIIYSFLYEQMTDLTKENIKKGITKMIGYEPRVSIINLDVNYKKDQSEVWINLKYSIPKLNTQVTDTFIIS